jgi:hypothetical protein
MPQFINPFLKKSGDLVRPALIDVAKVRAMKAKRMGGHRDSKGAEDWAGIGVEAVANQSIGVDLCVLQ